MSEKPPVVMNASDCLAGTIEASALGRGGLDGGSPVRWVTVGELREMYPDPNAEKPASPPKD